MNFQTMNMRIFRVQLLINIFGLLPFVLFCQPVDTSSFKINSRLSFYSFEKNGEFLLHVPPVLSQKNLSIKLIIGENTIASWNEKTGRTILRLPFSLNLTPSVYNVEAKITLATSPRATYQATTKLVVL